MIVENGDNTRLIEFMEELDSGMAIDQTYKDNSYKFYKENDKVLVYLDGDVIGHLEQHEATPYEVLNFHDWDSEKNYKFEWLGEIDAYKFNYVF